MTSTLWRTCIIAGWVGLASCESGSGRFNKGYCFHGHAWGNVSFWEDMIKHNETRTAQFSTVNTTGIYFLRVSPHHGGLGSFSLVNVPTNVTVDLGCQPRSMPGYSAIALGTYGLNNVTWATGPIGDVSKRPRCWWVRCDVNETEADMCGSEGETPCSSDGATFPRYLSPFAGGAEPPIEDTACYPIRLDSQVDPTHRVDFTVTFVDGLWPPGV